MSVQYIESRIAYYTELREWALVELFKLALRVALWNTEGIED